MLVTRVVCFEKHFFHKRIPKTVRLYIYICECSSQPMYTMEVISSAYNIFKAG